MPEEDELPRVLSGRYRLEATLGHGGMGVVYRGLDLMMKRPIAVKVVRAVDGVDIDEEIAGRFLREAKNTARLQHEHIIEVFDLGRAEDNSLYFVMELLEGESLSTRLRREGKLSPEVTVHIARQICEALQAAHAAGVVHRDLKPANIMLLPRAGDDQFVKVLDFGVAKSTSSEHETQLTHTGMLVGTVDYMAPEQITGRPVDARTDVYALGVVLYRMLSGHAPFRDVGVPALIHAHLNTMPKPLTEIATGIPNELDHVVLRCLAKDPERRFESMAELSRALTAAVMPDEQFIELEYGSGADLYSDAEMTKVAPSSFAQDELPLPEDPTLHEPPAFDDATIKLDRAPSIPVQPVAGRLPLPPRVGGQPPVAAPPLPGPPRAGAPMSPPPAAGPPSAVPYPMPPGPGSGPYPGAYGPPPGSSAVPAPQQQPWAPPPAPPPAPRSIWQRFLAWTGLRGR